MAKKSGQSPFVFSHCEDLHSLPQKATEVEVNLHGGFAVDKREGHGQIYYGMPGCGLMRISPDLTTQEVIELRTDLKDVNFHSTKIGEFDGNIRLFLPANGDAMIAVVTLEGEVDFILPVPEFEQYQGKEDTFKPTDTTLVGNQLFVADGYGANYISSVDLNTRKWSGIFGGLTHDINEHGKFRTAHGLNPTPKGDHLAIADRPHSRIEISTFAGHHHHSHSIPSGSRPCGIDFFQRGDQWYALVGSLDDPEVDQGRAAPIYILDANSYEVVSTIRPKEELGIELADHIHNTVWYEYNGRSYLICQAWNPGYYFVLEMTD